MPAGLGAWKTLSVALVASTAGYTTGLTKAAAQTRAFGSEIESTLSKGASGWDRFGKLAATAGKAIGVALVLAFGAAIKAAADFDEQMRNVNSISGLSQTQLQGLSQQVLKLSTSVPISATNLASGLYDIASSGFQGAAGMDVLTASAKAATAGMSSTSTAARTITGVLNAYGLGAGQARKVSDVLFQTVNTGVLTFDELAQNIGEVIPMAAQLHVPLEDVGAALATMTLTGSDAAQSSTQLRRVIVSFLQPSNALGNALHNLGYESGQQALQSDGLRGVMERLWDATGRNVTVFKALFPDIRAGAGALELMAQNGAVWNAQATYMAQATDGIGATQRTLNEQLKSFHNQLDVAKNKLVAFGIDVGMKVLPALIAMTQVIPRLVSQGWADLVGFARNLQGAWSDMVDAGQRLVSVLAALWRGVEPVAAAFAHLAGMAIVGVLRGAAEALDDLLGLLNRNQTAVRVFGTALAVYGIARLGLLAASALETGRVLAGVVALEQWERFGGVLSSLGPRVAAIGSGILQLVSGSASGLASLRAGFSGLGTALTSPTAAMVGLAVAIGGPIAAWQAGEAEAKRFISSVNQKIDTGQYTHLSQVIDALTTQADQLIEHAKQGGGVGGFLKGWAGTLGNMVTFGQGFKDFGLSALHSADNLQAAAARIQTVTSGLAGQLGVSTDSVIAWARNLNINLSNVDPSNLSDVANKIRDAANAAAAGTPATDTLAHSMGTVADITSSATDKMKAFKDALDAIIDPSANAWEAQAKLAGALADLPATIAKNGLAWNAAAGDIDRNTAAGRNLIDAYTNVTDQAKDTAKAMADRDGIDAGIAAMSSYRNQLDNVLRAAGYTADQIEEINSQLGLTPDNIAVLFQLRGADAAKQGATDLNTQLSILAQKNPVVVDIVPNVAPTLKDFLGGLLTGKLGPSAPPPTGGTQGLQDLLGGPLGMSSKTGGGGLGTSSVTVHASMDAKPLNDTMAQVRRDLGAFAGSTWRTRADADPRPADTIFDQLTGRANSWRSNNPSTNVGANAAPASTAFSWVFDRANAWRGNNPSTSVGANASPASGAFAWAFGSANAWRGANPSTSVFADTGPARSQIQALINEFRFSKIAIQLQAVAASRLGNVFPMAAGGVGSYADAGIGSGGPLYKWAEPETGGEAFIPRLGDSTRSKKILDVAASWYGLAVVPAGAVRPMAAGGVYGPSAGGASVVIQAGAVVVNGPVYGVDDLEAKMGQATTRLASDLQRKLAKR